MKERCWVHHKVNRVFVLSISRLQVCAMLFTLYTLHHYHYIVNYKFIVSSWRSFLMMRHDVRFYGGCFVAKSFVIIDMSGVQHVFMSNTNTRDSIQICYFLKLLPVSKYLCRCLTGRMFCRS